MSIDELVIWLGTQAQTCGPNYCCCCPIPLAFYYPSGFSLPKHIVRYCDLLAFRILFEMYPMLHACPLTGYLPCLQAQRAAGEPGPAGREPGTTGAAAAGHDEHRGEVPAAAPAVRHPRQVRGGHPRRGERLGALPEHFRQVSDRHLVYTISSLLPCGYRLASGPGALPGQKTEIKKVAKL